jgi:two-component system, OmpR family, KDP operon response regulator KdpE
MRQTGALRILVVDDEPGIVRFLRMSLVAQGYAVTTAGDARTTLDLVRRGAADLLVLDLGLPDMDGLDVVKRIRGSGAALPIIILSSRDEENPRSKRSIMAPTITSLSHLALMSF